MKRLKEAIDDGIMARERECVRRRRRSPGMGRIHRFDDLLRTAVRRTARQGPSGGHHERIALGELKREEHTLLDGGDDTIPGAVQNAYSVVASAPPTFIAIGILPQLSPELADVQVFEEPSALAGDLREGLPIEVLLSITESDGAARTSSFDVNVL